MSQPGVRQPYSLGTLRMGTPRMGTPPRCLQHHHIQLCPSQWVAPGPHCTGSPCKGWGQPPGTLCRCVRGGDTHTHSILLQTGKQRPMWFRSKVPRSSFGRGAGWEPSLCEDCPHAGDGAVLGADRGDFSQLPWGGRGAAALWRGSPCPQAQCCAKGDFPRAIPIQDMPPPCPEEGGDGARGGSAVNRGSVCRMAGQELPGGEGGWEGTRVASAPQLGRERCQPHSWGCRASRSVCGRRASARPPLPLPAAHPASPMPPGPAWPHGAYIHVPSSLGHPQAGPPLRSSAANPPCQGDLSRELPDTPGRMSLHGQPQCAVPSRGSLLRNRCSPWPALMQPGSQETQETGMGLGQGGREDREDRRMGESPPKSPPRPRGYISAHRNRVGST